MLKIATKLLTIYSIASAKASIFREVPSKLLLLDFTARRISKQIQFHHTQTARKHEQEQLTLNYQEHSVKLSKQLSLPRTVNTFQDSTRLVVGTSVQE